LGSEQALKGAAHKKTFIGTIFQGPPGCSVSGENAEAASMSFFDGSDCGFSRR
jgi:hypothetical protein